MIYDYSCFLPTLVSFAYYHYYHHIHSRYFHHIHSRFLPAHPEPAPFVGAGPVEQVEGPTLDELRALAQWLHLRDQTLPPLTVGDIEADPSGVADLYGVKGMLVPTAFVNMEDLSCRVCSFKAKTVHLAVLHQQQANHFQA